MSIDEFGSESFLINGGVVCPSTVQILGQCLGNWAEGAAEDAKIPREVVRKLLVEIRDGLLNMYGEDEQYEFAKIAVESFDEKVIWVDSSFEK